MLISTKTKNEKIVLGLLSYTYPDGTPSIEELKELIETYRQDDDSDLLLYKDEATDNYVGIAGITENTAETEGDEDSSPSMTVVLNRIAVIPSFRGEGVGFQMYQELKDRYPNATIIGSLLTMDLVTKWTNQYHDN